MKKSVSVQSTAGADIPEWAKKRGAEKTSADKKKKKKKAQHSKSMNDLKKSSSTSKVGGKMEPNDTMTSMDYNNLPARWFDQEKVMHIIMTSYEDTFLCKK